jgi:hypothetical protein
MTTSADFLAAGFAGSLARRAAHRAPDPEILTSKQRGRPARARMPLATSINSKVIATLAGEAPSNTRTSINGMAK